MPTIFVVDDEENICNLIGQYLLVEGFQVETFNSVEEVEVRLQSGFPDMFILDIMLPGKNGLEFCRELRKCSSVPVIFMSTQGKESVGVMSLELGGDDYLTKPFIPRELLARVRAVLRRSLDSIKPRVLEAGGVRIYPLDRRVTIEDQEAILTPKEYELVLQLIQQPQKTFTRQELSEQIWGYDYVGTARGIDDLVKRLRRKLKGCNTRGYIKTIWGLGYRFDA